VRTPQFWLLAAGFTFFLAAQIGSITHIVRLDGERALGMHAYVVPVITVSALLGRVIGSVALRRLSFWTVLLGVVTAQAVAVGGLVLVSSWAPYLIFAGLLGVAVGHSPLVQPLSIIETFGSLDFARLSALVQFLIAAGFGAGPVLASLAHDSVSGTWGGYRAAYLALLGCSLASFACLAWTASLVTHTRVRGGEED
jgi:hypothetical protein